MDRATKKFKKPPLLCLLMAPFAVCAADSIRVLMTPYTVGSTAGAHSKVVPLNYFDSLWAMMFLSDQSLLVAQKIGAFWSIELVWQSPGENDAAVESVPSVVRRISVAGLSDIRAEGQGHYGHRPAFSLGGMVAEVWSLGHRNPLGVEKRVSQTLH